MPQELKELRALHAKEPLTAFFSNDILVLKEEDIYIFFYFLLPIFLVVVCLIVGFFCVYFLLISTYTSESLKCLKTTHRT